MGGERYAPPISPILGLVGYLAAVEVPIDASGPQEATARALNQSTTDR